MLNGMDEPTATNDHDTKDEAGPTNGGTGERPTLQRSATKHVFGGVCGGIGERFDIDANIVRVVFVVIAAVYGLGVVVYLAMWVLITRAPSAEGDGVIVVDDEPAPRSRWLRIVTPLSVLVVLVLFVAVFFHARRGNHGLSVGVLHFDKGLIVLWLIFLLFLPVQLCSPL